jgi:ankyrin repeat protein
LLLNAESDSTTPVTTNAREAYLCNDSLLLLKQESKAHLSLAEISLADSKLRDRRYLVGIGQPAATALSWQLLTPDGKSYTFAAPDEDAKKAWMNAFTNALLDALPFDLRFQKGFVHTILQGTQWSASVLGDETVLRGLGALCDGASALDELDADGNAALHYAAFHGHADCVRALLEAGARIDVTDTSDFNTPLHIACCQGHLQVASLLAANLAPLNATNMCGSTPLMAVLQAQELGKVVPAPRTIDWLISQGADTNLADADGVLPIHRAVDLQHPQLISLLVRGGASANSPRPLPHEAGMLRPLHIACGTSVTLLPGSVDVDTIVALLAHGAQPNSVSGSPAATPLHALLRRIGMQNESPIADKAVNVAVLSSAATRLCGYGARLDVVDASGAALTKLADDLGCRAALESALRNFSARTASAAAADEVQRLNKVAVLPFVITAGEVCRKGRLGHVVAPWDTDTSPRCMLCAADFTVFSRRHHVRFPIPPVAVC